MIKSIKAENYKSIKSLELELGRVNVFIGENGAGKSNILEVFALAGAAVARKLDNEFLVSRGIRAARPELMRSAFFGADHSFAVLLAIEGWAGEAFEINLMSDNSPYSKWECRIDELNEYIRRNKILSNCVQIKGDSGVGSGFDVDFSGIDDKELGDVKEFLEFIIGFK